MLLNRGIRNVAIAAGAIASAIPLCLWLVALRLPHPFAKAITIGAFGLPSMLVLMGAWFVAARSPSRQIAGKPGATTQHHTESARLSRTIEMLTQQVSSGNVLLLKTLENDVQFNGWKGEVENWNRATLVLIRLRLTETDAELFDAAPLRGWWDGHNAEHGNLRGYLGARIACLEKMIGDQQGNLEKVHHPP